MRTVISAFLIWGWCVMLGTMAAGQPPEVTPPVREIPGHQPPEMATFDPVPPPPTVQSSPELNREIAGLARSDRSESLTWERVYALGLIRARGGRQGMREALNPATLSQLASQHGVADFARFRTEFLSGRAPDGPFRDPSGDYLELLRRLQTIENGRASVKSYESLSKLVEEIILGAAPAITRLDADHAVSALVGAQRELDGEVERYRNQLDEIKVALGLSPRARVIPDPHTLEGFSIVFKELDDWGRRPDRSLAALPRLIQRLPALGDVLIEGRPILGSLEQDPDRWETVLASAASTAIKNRKDRAEGQPSAQDDVALELRLRRRVRHLFEKRRSYESQKRSYELAVRLKDQALERLFAPRSPTAASRTPLLDALVEQMGRVRSVQDRLVALWTSFQAERLAFYRDLGALPYSDWSSFYAELSAREGPG
jgi:hypothetical protein